MIDNAIPIAFTRFKADESLSLWVFFADENYRCVKAVQVACKLLDRLGKPVTVKEFLQIDPLTYRGYYGVSDALNRDLSRFRRQIEMWLDWGNK